VIAVRRTFSASSRAARDNARGGSMDTVEIKATSRQSAVCTDIVLRDKAQVRLLFRPQLVDNPNDSRACVKGRFLYQKKGKNDEWQDFDSPSLATLTRGEQFALEVNSEELLKLLRHLGALYRLHQSQGFLWRISSVGTCRPRPRALGIPPLGSRYSRSKEQDRPRRCRKTGNTSSASELALCRSGARAGRSWESACQDSR
jgi:antiviral defense system Shedu protein SduA